LVESIFLARTVTDQAAAFSKLTCPVNGGNRVASGQCDEPLALREAERVAGNKKRT